MQPSFAALACFILAASAAAQEPVPLGPLGGSASAVAVHPNDDLRLLVGTFPDGLLASDDGGRSFAAFGSGLPAGSGIRDFVVDPVVADRVYALVDDRIYASNDFGATWAPMSLVASSSLVSLSVDASGMLMLAASGDTIYRSANAGASWSAVHSGLIIEQVILAPSNASVAYAGSLNGLERSDDGGMTWSSPGGMSNWVMAIAVDPGDEDTVYVGGFATFQVSFDGGASFTPRTSGLPATSFQFLAFEPTDPTRQAIWAGVLDGIYGTRDGGLNWHETNRGFPGNFPPIPSDLAFDGAGRKKLATEGGFFVAGAGIPRWTQTGFANVELYDVAVVKKGAYLACNFQGVYGRRPGESFQPTGWFFDFGASTDVIVVDPRDPRRWLAGGVGAFIDNATVRVLTDLGFTVETPYEEYGAGQVRSLAFDPFDPSRVLGGVWPAGFGSMGLIGSLDGGDHWAPIPGTAGWSCAEVAWDPHQRDHAIAYLDSGFWAESFDGGQTWQDSQTWPTGPSVFFAFDPFDPKVYYLAEDFGGVYRSDDAGATWTPLGVSAHWRSDIALSPIAPGLLWVSDEDGAVLLSGDRGATWVRVFQAPNGVNASGLAWDADGNALVIGTTGASAYALPDASPYAVIGAGLAGSGGFVPRHYAENGLPRLGSATWSLGADRLLGGTNAHLYAGRNSGAEPFFGGTRYAFPPTILSVGLSTNGVPNAPGSGSISFTTGIPNRAGLVGTAVYSQVLVVDPAAPQGVALSAGLRTVLLP
ncbi:MAG: hypothetical protein EYC70_01085 [Planctomycetota bacterium]|nr:MAG: hypothetical protein EYC70_01085 [Planctomycetota bacterium]